MGIQGLLPQLRSIMQPIHVQDLRGQTVAVDTYSWLHKGAVYCSLELCKGIPTSRHIEYCLHRVKLLQHHGVKPVLVFDGGLLPMKIDQETKRARKRKENLERALEHEAAGNSGAAFDCYQKAVDISPSIAFELIKVLKQEKVDYIVAPYEADAQMTFLSIYKHVDAVITEDSDLIPFGCSRVIFKMDKFGQGVEFRSSMLEQNRDLDFTRFTKQMILEMCILSGCDYLPSLPGMGLKRAHALIRRYKSYDKVTKHLRYSGASIPPLYEESFRKAVWAFQYQRVYDPEKECIVHLSDVPQGIGEALEFLGPWLPPDVAKAIANGDLDPLTKMPFQVETASTVLFVDKMFSTERFEPIGRGKRLNLPVQKNVLTNYFCLASIEAKRKFRAPKFMPKHLKESATPSCGCDDLDSPGSDELPLSSITNQSQDSLLNSRDLEDELPVKVSMEYRLPNKCNEFLEFPSHGSSLLESHHNSDEPFMKSHEDHEAESKRSSLKNRQSVKRNIITRSPFFHNNSVHEVAAGDPNEVSWKKEYDNVLDDYPVSTDESMQTSFRETSIKKRKAEAIHLHEDSLPLGNLKSTSATSGQGKNISSSSELDDVKTKNFLRDISHVNDYRVIAEKSMDRFVSLMNSFRHNSSGSRASGLRAPLKDVRNTFSISSNKAPVDFSEFSYKPSKRPAQIVSSRSNKID